VPFHASGRVICSTLPDFSADRNIVLAVLRAIVPGDAATGVGASSGDKLKALETVASMLSKVADKKTLIYISGGVNKPGNQAQMEASINALMAVAPYFKLDKKAASQILAEVERASAGFEVSLAQFVDVLVCARDCLFGGAIHVIAQDAPRTKQGRQRIEIGAQLPAANLGDFVGDVVETRKLFVSQHPAYLR